MPAMQAEQALANHGIYQSKDRKGVESWFAFWYDHAGRLIRKRIGPTRDIKTRRTAKRRAQQMYQQYADTYESNLALKDAATWDELEELASRVAFPRQVVEHEIRRICDRLARETVSEEQAANAAQAGVQMFADRSGISGRQVHRMLEDEEYISVGLGIVDKICVEFDMIFNDFIESAHDWAEKRGQWSDRVGARDPWPWGYQLNESDSEEDDLL